MTKYDALLQLVRECDYRVVDESGCGCSSGRTRCLLGLGKWARDRNEVNTSDCLECTKGGENGRTVDEDLEVTERNGGVTDHHRGLASQDFGDGAASREHLVPVAEGPVEREVLRLEREMRQLWDDVRLIQSFRQPPREQNVASLFNTTKGGGIGTPKPHGYGCDSGMALSVQYWDSMLGPLILNYDVSSNTFISDQTLLSVRGGCGCSAQNNVPIQVVWSPSSVDINYKADMSGCPTSGSLGDPMTGQASWGGVPTISNCGASDPNTFTSDSSGMTNPNPSFSGPGCQLGYNPFSDSDPDFGNAVAGSGDCPYVPRHLVWRESALGLRAVLNYSGGFWQGTCSVDFAGNASCTPVSGMNLLIKHFATYDGDPAGTVTYLAIDLSPPSCPNPSSPITRTGEKWSYHRNCSTPYAGSGSLVNLNLGINALWGNNGVMTASSYTLRGK